MSRKNERYRYNGDEVLHAAFQILVDFVEGEDDPFGENRDTWEESEEQCCATEELKQLYCWYATIRRLRCHAEWPWSFVPNIDGINDPVICDAWDKHCDERSRLQSAWIKEDDEMLVRLVAVRRWIWNQN